MLGHIKKCHKALSCQLVGTGSLHLMDTGGDLGSGKVFQGRGRAGRGWNLVDGTKGRLGWELLAKHILSSQASGIQQGSP